MSSSDDGPLGRLEGFYFDHSKKKYFPLSKFNSYQQSTSTSESSKSNQNYQLQQRQLRLQHQRLHRRQQLPLNYNDLLSFKDLNLSSYYSSFNSLNDLYQSNGLSKFTVSD